jgi:hypothetical protein
MTTRPRRHRPDLFTDRTPHPDVTHSPYSAAPPSAEPDARRGSRRRPGRGAHVLALVALGRGRPATRRPPVVGADDDSPFVRVAEHFVESFQRWACVPHRWPIRSPGFLRARGRTTAPVLAVTEDLLRTDPAASELGLDRAETWARVTEAGVSEVRATPDTVAATVALSESRPVVASPRSNRPNPRFIAATSSPPRRPSSRPPSDTRRARSDPATPTRNGRPPAPPTIGPQWLREAERPAG